MKNIKNSLEILILCILAYPAYSLEMDRDKTIDKMVSIYDASCPKNIAEMLSLTEEQCAVVRASALEKCTKIVGTGMPEKITDRETLSLLGHRFTYCNLFEASGIEFSPKTFDKYIQMYEFSANTGMFLTINKK